MSGLLKNPDSFPLDAARIHSPVAFAKSLHVAIIINNNEKFRSFKSKENIHKKEVGPYRSFGY